MDLLNFKIHPESYPFSSLFLHPLCSKTFSFTSITTTVNLTGLPTFNLNQHLHPHSNKNDILKHVRPWDSFAQNLVVVLMLFREETCSCRPFDFPFALTSPHASCTAATGVHRIHQRSSCLEGPILALSSLCNKTAWELQLLFSLNRSYLKLQSATFLPHSSRFRTPFLALYFSIFQSTHQSFSTYHVIY